MLMMAPWTTTRQKKNNHSPGRQHRRASSPLLQLPLGIGPWGSFFVFALVAVVRSIKTEGLGPKGNRTARRATPKELISQMDNLIDLIAKAATVFYALLVVAISITAMATLVTILLRHMERHL